MHLEEEIEETGVSEEMEEVGQFHQDQTLVGSAMNQTPPGIPAQPIGFMLIKPGNVVHQQHVQWSTKSPQKVKIENLASPARKKLKLLTPSKQVIC